jgi:hypothetical protein
MPSAIPRTVGRKYFVVIVIFAYAPPAGASHKQDQETSPAIGDCKSIS